MKKAICKIFAHFLYRGIKVLYKKDERVRKEIDAMPDNISFVLKYGIEDNAPFTKIEKTKDGLKKSKIIEDDDIVITFKTLDLALKVMTGGKGLSTAYSEHDFTLRGSINECMGFVRVVEIVMAHLLPKKMLRKILREVPERKISLFSTYILAIFGN